MVVAIFLRHFATELVSLVSTQLSASEYWERELNVAHELFEVIQIMVFEVFGHRQQHPQTGQQGGGGVRDLAFHLAAAEADQCVFQVHPTFWGAVI